MVALLLLSAVLQWVMTFKVSASSRGRAKAILARVLKMMMARGNQAKGDSLARAMVMTAMRIVMARSSQTTRTRERGGSGNGGYSRKGDYDDVILI
jgi:hypothetical protein